MRKIGRHRVRRFEKAVFDDVAVYGKGGVGEHDGFRWVGDARIEGGVGLCAWEVLRVVAEGCRARHVGEQHREHDHVLTIFTLD